MSLAVSAMDPTVQGILFLVAVILFVIAAVVAARPGGLGWLVPAGLAFFTFVWMWNAFSAS